MVLCVSGFPAAAQDQSGGGEKNTWFLGPHRRVLREPISLPQLSSPSYPAMGTAEPRCSLSSSSSSSTSSSSSAPSLCPNIPVPTTLRSHPQPGPSKTPTPLIAIDSTGLGDSSTPAQVPTSRVLISGAKRGNPAPSRNNINLRYQSMSMVDPTSHTTPVPRPRKKTREPPMTSSRRTSSPGRGCRPKPCPMLEAIPNSWASASRPSDLRPNPPAPQPSKVPTSAASRPSPPPPPPPLPAVRSTAARVRSKSAERVGSKPSVMGPRSPRRCAVQLVQPTPKRLSLGMVMDTTKLVSSDSACKRCVPASPNAAPALARLPISGSHYARELSPSPLPRVLRSTSPVSPPALGPRLLPALQPSSPSPKPPPIATASPSPRRPLLHLNPTVPLSPFTSSPPSVPSSVSPKSPSVNAIATPATTSSYISALSKCDGDTRYDSPVSGGRDGHLEPQIHDTHTLDKSNSNIQETIPSFSPILPSSLPIKEEEEHQGYLDDLEAYDWTLDEEEGQYDDQLFRIPISPTSSTSSSHPLNDSGPIVEVFVDNLYCGDAERSPSPIVYARPADSDYSDEESNGGRRRRARRRLEEALGGEGLQSESAGVANPSSPSSHDRQGNSHPSPSMSYHSDDSSLYYTGTQPLPSRRKKKEQLRAYRYSFRPQHASAAAAAAAAASNTLAGLPTKSVAGGGPGITKATKSVGCKRNPSPIAYARRRSLDGLYDFDSEDEMDDGEGDVFGGGREGGSSWDSRRTTAGGFFIANPRFGRGKKRRMVQPRSFMHAYSKPPDVTSFEAHSEERERVIEKEKEKERGRRKERTLISMPLGGYNNSGNGNGNGGGHGYKEREKEKEGKEKPPRTRKISRGFLDELAAVAARKTNSSNNNHNSATPRTSGGSPPPPLPPLPPLPLHSKERDREDKDKEKEKEKKRKWVWELSNNNSKSDSGSAAKEKVVVCSGPHNGEGLGAENVVVLDIGCTNYMHNNGRKVGSRSGEGYEGWNKEWPDEDLEGGSRGEWRRGKKQRHSLNGLEFV